MTTHEHGKWTIPIVLWTLSAGSALLAEQPRAVGAERNRDVVVSCQLAGADSGADYVFVLDVSGSMGDSGRLALCRNFLRAFVKQLHESDRLDIVTFNTKPRSLFGKLVGVDAPTRRRVHELLKFQRASGRTAIARTLSWVYRRADGARRFHVLLLSDGMTDRRERMDLAKLIRGRPPKSQVLCIAVGDDTDRPLLGRLARPAGGLAAFLSPGDDFRRLSEVLHRDLLRGARLAVVDRDALKIELQRGNSAVADLAATRAGRTRELKLKLPKPLFYGTPRRIRVPYRRPNRNRKIVVPVGMDVRNVARGKAVTSSEKDPIIGKIGMVTDGDKEGTDGSYVELMPGRQWVQIDLQATCDIYVIVLWHYHREQCVYQDVIVQVADDPNFLLNVETVFNNDRDNSSGLGVGRDSQYLEYYKGEAIQFHPSEPVTGRYVRFYSNGNSTNDLNHYTEVEIWGRAAR